MPIYLDTSGKTTLGIGVCGRCGIKHGLDELIGDPNTGGALRVCRDDLDLLDPYRLPAPPADQIQLQNPRPDLVLQVGPQVVPINQFQAVLAANTGADIGNPAIAAANAVSVLTPGQPGAISSTTPWTASTNYALGARITPTNPVGFVAAGNNFSVFVCIIPGVSAATAPTWPVTEGTIIVDGTVLWINDGAYFP